MSKSKRVMVRVDDKMMARVREYTRRLYDLGIDLSDAEALRALALRGLNDFESKGLTP